MILPSFLGPPWPARPGYLHPFAHRLTKETSPWFDPFHELAPIPSSLIQHQLFASGRRQTSHILRSSDGLHPAIQLSGHSPLPKLAQCSELLGHPIPDALCVVTYIVCHPTAPISACNTSNRCVRTQSSLRVDSPSSVFVAAIGCRNVIHTDLPITDRALVSLD